MEPKTPHKNRAGHLTCHHCGAENPTKAYCCLSCFKVLRPKEKLPFWQVEINPGLKGFLMIAAFLLVTAVGIRRWLAGIDAQLSMHMESSDYNLSLVANKRHASMFHLSRNSKEAAPSPAASDDGETAASVSQP